MEPIFSIHNRVNVILNFGMTGNTTFLLIDTKHSNISSRQLIKRTVTRYRVNYEEKMAVEVRIGDFPFPTTLSPLLTPDFSFQRFAEIKFIYS